MALSLNMKAGGRDQDGDGNAASTSTDEHQQRQKGHDEDDPLFLALGWKFQPTDKELVVTFLYNKVAGLRIFPENIIIDCDVYKTEPWNLPRNQLYGDGKDVYYFTQVKKLSNKDHRVCRNTPRGYWHANGSHVKIHHGDKLVGHSMQLKYIHKVKEKKTGTRWIMHEYRLDTPAGEKRKGNEETVLCRIRTNGRSGFDPIEES